MTKNFDLLSAIVSKQTREQKFTVDLAELINILKANSKTELNLKSAEESLSSQNNQVYKYLGKCMSGKFS